MVNKKYYIFALLAALFVNQSDVHAMQKRARGAQRATRIQQQVDTVQELLRAPMPDSAEWNNSVKAAIRSLQRTSPDLAGQYRQRYQQITGKVLVQQPVVVQESVARPTTEEVEGPVYGPETLGEFKARATKQLVEQSLGLVKKYPASGLWRKEFTSALADLRSTANADLADDYQKQFDAVTAGVVATPTRTAIEIVFDSFIKNPSNEFWKKRVLKEIELLKKIDADKAAVYQQEYDALVAEKVQIVEEEPVAELSDQAGHEEVAATSKNDAEIKHWEVVVRGSLNALKSSYSDDAALRCSSAIGGLGVYSPELAAEYKDQLNDIVASHRAIVERKQAAKNLDKAEVTEQDLMGYFKKLKMQLSKERPSAFLVKKLKEDIQTSIKNLKDMGFADKANEYQVEYDALITQ